MSFELPELEYVIVRLLENAPKGMTGYDIRKVVETTFTKWSHQQVYRTLNRHVASLFYVRKVPQEGKPDKKVYTLKPSNFTIALDKYHTETIMFCKCLVDIEIKIEMVEEKVDALLEVVHNESANPINALRLAILQEEVKALELTRAALKA